jgi:hypothetical protein
VLYLFCVLTQDAGCNGLLTLVSKVDYPANYTPRVLNFELARLTGGTRGVLFMAGMMTQSTMRRLDRKHYT